MPQLFLNYSVFTSKIFFQGLSGQNTKLDVIIVPLFDGNSEIGALVRSLICLKHFVRSRAVTNSDFFSEKTYFPSYVRNLF